MQLPEEWELGMEPVGMWPEEDLGEAEDICGMAEVKAMRQA